MSISMTRVVASRSASSEGKEEEGAAAVAAAAQAGFRASVTCGREGGNGNSLVFLVGIFFGCAYVISAVFVFLSDLK